MELFGILFSIPISFIISFIYFKIISYIINERIFFSKWILLSSKLIILLFVIELLLIIFLGVSTLQNMSNGLYYVIHLGLFFLLLPSFINIIIIKISFLNKWYIAVPVSVIFSIIIIFYQIFVSERLFDIH